MNGKKILAIRSFNTDLFEINFRAILASENYKQIVIAGDRKTIRRVPKRAGFSCFKFEHPISIASVINLYRYLWREGFDCLYYGADDIRGIGALPVDFFALIVPWKQLCVSHHLRMNQIESKLALCKVVFFKLLQLPLFLCERSKPYVLRFSDKLLNADAHVDFDFKEKTPALSKQTVQEETRNSFSLSSGESAQLELSGMNVKSLSIGIANGVEKVRDGLLEFSLVENGQKKVVLQQETQTLLSGWNDYEFKLDGEKSSSNITLECNLVNGPKKTFISFPFIKKAMSQKNIIVIILDGIHKNYFGSYNSAVQNCTENIDHFFEDQLKYESVFSQEIWTRPTFASMMTSYYASHHRLADKNFFMELPKAVPTLAEVLRRNGFHTVGYVSHRLANQLYGFSRGFDRFVWRQTNEKPHYNARDITYFALETLAENKNRNTFMFLHYFDTHLPFFPKSPYCYHGRKKDFRNASEVYLKCKQNRFFRDEDRELINQVALNKVRELDCILEPLFLKLKSKDFAENTSVVFTSDHGPGRLHADAVLDDGIFRLTDEVVEIPLLVSPASNLSLNPSEIRQDQLVEGSVDLFPSVLELAGVDAPYSSYAKSYVTSKKVRGEIKNAISEAIYFDTYQLLLRTPELRYYLKCSKEAGSFDIDLTSGEFQEGIVQPNSEANHSKLLPLNSQQSEKFKELRETLHLGEYHLEQQVLTH